MKRSALNLCYYNYRQIGNLQNHYLRFSFIVCILVYTLFNGDYIFHSSIKALIYYVQILYI